MRWLIKMMSKTNKSKRGFTLIELMVVVIVVGILAAAAIPIYRFAMSRAYSSEARATMGTMLTSMKMFAAEEDDPTLYPLEVLDITSNEDAVADPPTDAMYILGVDTRTNTWWHAGLASDGTAVPDTSCIFGTTAAGSFPHTESGITGPIGTTGPYVWTKGTGDPITGIGLVYDIGTDKWYTSF